MAAALEERAERQPLIGRGYRLAFVLVTCLFLSWALAAALNDILIRQFQKALDLTRGQSSLVQMAFYVGYFCAAVPAGLAIRRLGYKAVMLVGLALYAGGAFLFYPAAEIREYWLFLAALYTIAFGLAFLETAANPYIAKLGPSPTASARLNLAQAFYGVGAILGPIIGGAFIFSGVEHSRTALAAMPAAQLDAYRATEASMVQAPYVVIGLVVCLLAVIIAATKLPNLTSGEGATSARGQVLRVLRHPRLRWSVIAQFFYVGAQVGVWSFFIDFTKEAAPGFPEKTAAFLLSGSFVMLLIGRFSGAFIQSRIAPARLLAAYGVANVLLCLTAALATGLPAVAALWATSFFMSIMFPTIFALGIEDLGEETELAASFLIMSIIGGAVIPPLMGVLSDALGRVQPIMIVPAVCFAVCVGFAIRAPRLGRAAA